MSKRGHISFKTKYACALLKLGDVPYEHAKLMTADQIISLYRVDHYPIPHGLDGSDHPANLQPLLIAKHAFKTNKDNGTGRSDRTMIARSDRIVKERTDPKPKRKINARVNPWPPKGSRKLQGRGFERRRAAQAPRSAR